MAATQIFPQFSLLQGAFATAAVTPAAGVSAMELHMTAPDAATLLDAKVQISIDDGASFFDGPAITGATPRNGKTGAFVGEIAWAGDLFPRDASGNPLRVTDSHSRLKVTGVNNSGKTVLLGPANLTLS